MNNKVRVNLENVKISFSNIYEPKLFNGIAKYSANFLIEKSDKEQIQIIKKAMTDLVFWNFGKQSPKFSEENTCIKDGDKKKWKDYSNKFFLSSSSKFKTVVKDIYNEECLDIKDGDLVNAVIDLWIQNNEHGIRINATLAGVQKIKGSDYIKPKSLLVAATSESKLYSNEIPAFTPKIKNLNALDWDLITKQAELKEKDIQDAMDNSEIALIFPDVIKGLK